VKWLGIAKFWILDSYTSENLTLTFYAPTEVTINVIAPSNQRKNPKSEYRNPKQTQRQINLKSGKSKTPKLKEDCLEFYLFWSFEIVSNFGFRASNFLFLAPFASLRETWFSDVLFNSDFQIRLARFWIFYYRSKISTL